MSSISVILLSYRRPEKLRLVLQSVLGQERKADEIVVIDNRSDRSDRIAEVVSAFPGVRLIRNDANPGFSRSMNLAAESATGDLLFLALDDRELHPKCLAELAGFLARNPGPNAATGLLYRERTGVIQCAGGRMTLGVDFELEFIGAGLKSLPGGNEPFQVSYVPGGMVLMERNLFRRIGGYRSGFFLYHEDTEFSERARRLGCALWAVPTAVAYDTVDQPKPSFRVGVSKVTNFFSLYVLHAPGSVLAPFLLKYVFLAPLKLLFSSPGQALQWIMAEFVAASRLPGLVRDRLAIAAAAKAGRLTGAPALSRPSPDR